MVAWKTSVVAVLVCLACAEDTHVVEYTDSGSLCVRSTETGSVKVRVLFPACLSSSCDEVISSTCEVTETSGTIQVTAHSQVESEGGECTADCGFLVAECESAPLEPGSYTVVYGANADDIVLPADGEVLFSSGTGVDYCP
jgi:hypothetical protein